MSKTGTGTDRELTREKSELRKGEQAGVTGVRPAVPDDYNSQHTYRDWQPGKLRPFTPQFNFVPTPRNALVDGPVRLGTLNGIKDQGSMREPSSFKMHGIKK